MDVDDLHAPANERRHRREWRIDRIGWGILIAILLCALLGLFGARGPLNAAERRSGELVVRYERFLRHEAPSSLHLTSPAQGPEVTVALSRALVEDATFEQILPEPRSQRMDGDRIVFVFATDGPLDVQFQLRTTAYGRRSGEIRVGSDAVPIAFFVYP